MIVVRAETGDDLTSVKRLFIEYAESLGFNLCFQDFDHELEELPGEYALPPTVAGVSAAGWPRRSSSLLESWDTGR
jgi:hypothetical protein